MKGDTAIDSIYMYLIYFSGKKLFKRAYYSFKEWKKKNELRDNTKQQMGLGSYFGNIIHNQ